MQATNSERFWIVPSNDLESQEIAAVLQEAGECFAVTRQSWGARWDRLETEVVQGWENYRLHHSTAVLYGVELAGPNGLGGVNIDHHRYAGEDRCCRLSSLEQVAAVLGHTLSRSRRLIAANDRGWIPALLAEGASWGEVRTIRERDRRAQGVTPAQEEQAERDVKAGRREAGVWVVHCPRGQNSAHMDLLAFHIGAPEAALFIGPRIWSYSGSRSADLSRLNLPENNWSGGGPGFGYFAVEEPGRESRQHIRQVLGLSAE